MRGAEPHRTDVGVVIAAAVVLATAAAARAQSPVFVGIDASAAVPLTEPQNTTFGWGTRLSAAALVPLVPWLLGTIRLDGVVLSDGARPDDPNLVDPGIGGAYGATLGLRLRLRGLHDANARRRADGVWLAVDAGGAFTGSLARPLFAVSLGWALEAGPVQLGPTVRFVHLVHFDDPLDDRGALLLSFGLELVVLDEQALPLPELDAVDDSIADEGSACASGDEEGCPAEPEPEPEVNVDADDDGILDANDACSWHPETVNGVDDRDGYPDEGLITMVEGRIVLEERVLFAFARSRIRRAARPTLEALVELWRQHPEWRHVRIEGHADERGSDEVNLGLSTRRAERVREALIELGMPADLLSTVGYGATRPRDTRGTEAAMEANRRVEFVVVDDGGAP